MAPDSVELDALGASDSALIGEVLKACEAAQSFIDIKPFRRDHIAQIESIERLEQLGYLSKERVADKEFYRVSWTAIVQMQDSSIAVALMETAESMWSMFQRHYDKVLEQPVSIGSIADSLDLAIERVMFLYTYMRELWQTPSCISLPGSPNQAVIVREEVLRYPTFAGCVQELRELRGRQRQSPTPGFVWSDLTELESKAPPMSAAEVARRPSWMAKLPPHAQSLMIEIYTAMGANLLALPAMGIRAVIDVVSDDLLGAPRGNFAGKLDALRASGHLTPKQFDVLRAVVEVGHAAAHRAHSPDQGAIQLMLDSLEHMLFSAYELDGASSALSAKTPSRPVRVKAAK